MEKTTHEELYDPYSSPNIIRVIKSWTMTWAGYEVYIGNTRDAYRVVGGGDLRERDHLENAEVDGRTIIKWIFKKWDGGHGLDWCGS